MPLPNPYSPGELPRVLVGRAAEQARIRDRLGRVHSFGELAGPLLVLHAPRGLGKTSLLRQAERMAVELGFVVAWTSCAKGSRLLPDLVHAVRRALEASPALPERVTRDWGVDRVGVEIGVPGAKVNTELDVGATPEPVAGAIGAVEDLLHDSAVLVRERGGAGLLVLVDELHAARFDELAVLLNAVQNLGGARADNPLAVMAAGLPSTPEMISRAATFGERSEFVPLDRFDRADSEAVLTTPARELGVRWSAEAVERVLEVAAGHPYYLQLMGYGTWYAARPDEGSELVRDDVEAGEATTEEQLAAMYRARWDTSPELEQEFMAAMAAHPDEVVPRAAVAAALGRESRAISVPRARLIDRGIIEAAGRGLLRFTLPGMAGWIRER